MGAMVSERRPSTAVSTQSTVVRDEQSPAIPTAVNNPSSPNTSPLPTPTYPLPFGKPVLAEFQLDPTYHNLNHGSFGTIPSHITVRLRHYQAQYERAPDPFIRYTYPQLLDTNRAAIATLLHAPHIDEVVFVSNTTVGINTVLRALADTAPSSAPDVVDEILYFSTIYGACGNTVAYVTSTPHSHGRIAAREIPLTYPISAAAILAAFHAAVDASLADGKRPRVAVFDAVSSQPGIRVPFEALIAACRERGVLSCVDAAHGVGMIELDLEKLDPDFLVSNCHKWLFVPRGCAVLYVPRRNQALVRSTVPTSHGYVPPVGSERRKDPLPPSEHSAFEKNFEFVGTLDNSPFLCVADAIEWRERVLGGEERIRKYLTGLANSGGEEVARAMGTWVLEGAEGDCAMVNVAMPLVVEPEGGDDVKQEAVFEDGRIREADVEDAAPVNTLDGEGDSTKAKIRSVRDSDTVLPHKDAERVWVWMTKVLVDEYKTFIPAYYHDGRFWARLSAQVYLDRDDFVWAGQTLKVLCERVAKKEYDL